MNKLYFPEFPNHSYVKKCQDYIDVIKGFRVGVKYPDFTAPDLDGKMHTLSDLIKGKISIINLWASW